MMSRLSSSGATLALASTLLVSFLSRTEDATASEPGRPNVIIVLTDDQGCGDLSCLGNPVLKTPNLDHLFAESVRLTDFHVAPTYEFRLRRWPDDVDAPLCGTVPAHHGEDGDYPAGVALPIATARLMVGTHDLQKKVAATDQEASFVVELPAGRTTLQTWFLDDQQQEICGAYYVYARYVD